MLSMVLLSPLRTKLLEKLMNAFVLLLYLHLMNYGMLGFWWFLHTGRLRCVASGAKIILSKLPIGDLATQFFADRNLFCAGRVAQDDMARVAKVEGKTVGGELKEAEGG